MRDDGNIAVVKQTLRRDGPHHLFLGPLAGIVIGKKAYEAASEDQKRNALAVRRRCGAVQHLMHTDGFSRHAKRRRNRIVVDKLVVIRFAILVKKRVLVAAVKI